MDVILECTENGAGACRNESMILELRADLDAARAEVAALREQRDIAQAQRNDAYAALKIALSERDAARAEVAALREKVDALRAACDNVASNMERTSIWSDWHSQVAVSILRDALNATE